jgi:GPH family glycoside/pentoside/hexuronide:cation symporter
LTGVVFWTKVSRTVEKKRLYFIGTLTTALVMASAYLFLGEGHVFGTANLPPLLIGHGLAGFFASVLWIIPASMIADVADEDELENGERREGVFFGLFNFGEQMAAAGSLLIGGVLIDRFAGLVPGQTEQSATTIVRIGMLYGLLPSVLLALAALMVLGYSLDQDKVRTIQARLTRDREIGNHLGNGSSRG